MSSELRTKTVYFAEANNIRSLFELAATVVGYAFFVYALYLSYLNIGLFWPAYIVFFVIAGLFMVKLFALFHDCTHNSMFTSPTVNTWTGRLLSLIITMPFMSWKMEHEDHHSHSVDMEKIYYGDVPLLTVEQYRKKTPFERVRYSIFRQPLFFLLVAPFLYLFIKARLPWMMNRQVILSVLITNVFIAVIYIPLLFYFGFWVMLFVFATPAYLSGMIGITLFYLQHNYPDASWFKTEDWDHANASMEGSSLIILPQPFEWFSHAIGYHHIHHLNSKIPGYRLRECYESVPEFRTVKPLSWKEMVDAFKLRLWSYEQNKLVSLKEGAKLST